MKDNETRQKANSRPRKRKSLPHRDAAGEKKNAGDRAQRTGLRPEGSARPSFEKGADGKKREKKEAAAGRGRKGTSAQSQRTRGSRDAQRQRKSVRKGPPRIHDDYDDIRSYGGRYLKLPDYDELESASFSNADLLSFSKENKNQDAAKDEKAPTHTTSALSDGQAPVAGRNAVRELLRSGRSVDKLFVKAGRREGSLIAIVAEAKKKGIPISEVAQEKLDQLARGANHQGVVAVAAEKAYVDIDTILHIAAQRGELPLVVVADSIEDPHNLGALIRCAECAGAHGVIIPKRHSAGLTPVVAKASAGALEHMAVARVSNIAQAVTQLKDRGLWVFVAEADGTPYYEADFHVPAAILFGSEGAGVSKTVREKSDFIVSIPMYGKVNSLNVSTAASVILCHAARMQHVE